MSKIVFLNSGVLKYDSRTNRYIKILQNNNISYTTIWWNRTGIDCDKNDIVYNKKASFGSGYKNILNLISWNWFLLKKLFELRKEFSYIHSKNFDTVIPAYIISRLYSKKMIFDIYDKYSEARNMKGVIKSIFDKAELFFAKKSYALILPDECRYKQLGLKDKDYYIIENVPNNSNFIDNISKNDDDILRLSYVGTLDKHRGIEILLSIVSKHNNIKLQIAGDGMLLDLVKDFAEKFDNIEYFGLIEHKAGMQIMLNSDIIIGFYHKTIKNHIYAAPNKYYEHLMLGKPLLTTIGTPPGDKVIKYDTGFAIDENEKELENFLIHISKEQCKAKGEKAKKIWNTHYKKYYNGFADKIYVDKILGI